MRLLLTAMPISHHVVLSTLCLWAIHGVTVQPSQVSQTIASNSGEEDFFQMVGFVSETDSAHVSGHFLKLPDAIGRFSVSPPLPGGCGTLNSINEAGKLHDPPCKYLVNGGFFDISSDRAHHGTDDCIGNLVSNGQVIQTHLFNETNVQFGVKDGQYVIGYIDKAEAEQFEQLIEGMGWIVRNGKNYARPFEAGGLENATGWSEAYRHVQRETYPTQSTGRVSIGYNALGELLVLVVDGHRVDEKVWGATMYEIADRMVEFGAIEAMSLDGGGSTQMWVDGQQLGYASDQTAWGALAKDGHDPGCVGLLGPSQGPFECTRKVSSFLCITDQTPSGGVGMGVPLGVFALGCAVVLLTIASLRRGSRTESMLSSHDSSTEEEHPAGARPV